MKSLVCKIPLTTSSNLLVEGIGAAQNVVSKNWERRSVPPSGLMDKLSIPFKNGRMALCADDALKWRRATSLLVENNGM